MSGLVGRTGESFRRWYFTVSRDTKNLKFRNSFLAIRLETSLHFTGREPDVTPYSRFPVSYGSLVKSSGPLVDLVRSSFPTQYDTIVNGL